MRASRIVPIFLVALTLAAALFAVATARAAREADYKGLHIDVSLTPKRFGPISVEVKRVLEVDKNLEAMLVFHNSARTKARMVDRFRDAAFAAGGTGQQLYVADEGCFFGSPSICLEYLDRVDLSPGRSGDRVLTATANEAGEDPLTAGHYEYTRPVRFGFPATEREPVRADLRVSYDVTGP